MYEAEAEAEAEAQGVTYGWFSWSALSFSANATYTVAYVDRGEEGAYVHG